MPADVSTRRKPGPDGQTTRKRLIAAALDLFGRKGFDGVGAREIATAAGAQLAAIPYHFGTKEALYRAALEQVQQRLRTALEPAAERARIALASSPEDASAAVRALQGALLEAIVGNPEAESWAKLLLREHLDPSSAFDLVYEDAAKDAVELIAALLARASGRSRDDPAMLIEAFAKVGEVIMFRLTHYAVARRLGWREIGPREMSEIRKTLDWL